jgi:hypothetical protein
VSVAGVTVIWRAIHASMARVKTTVSVYAIMDIFGSQQHEAHLALAHKEPLFHTLGGDKVQSRY